MHSIKTIINKYELIKIRYISLTFVLQGQLSLLYARHILQFCHKL